MTNRLRTLIARFIVRYLSAPRSLLVAAWGWLAAATDDLGRKQIYLEAILVLEPDNEQAYMALLWVQQQQQAVTDLHPANAEELANIAEETGAEVLRGALRYPSESGGWQLGDVDLGEHLGKYRDREIIVTIASVGKAERKPHICGICGFVMDEAGECPRCRLAIASDAQALRNRQQREREQLFDDIERFLDGQ
jgi:hypothetical protein